MSISVVPSLHDREAPVPPHLDATLHKHDVVGIPAAGLRRQKVGAWCQTHVWCTTKAYKESHSDWMLESASQCIATAMMDLCYPRLYETTGKGPAPDLITHH